MDPTTDSVQKADKSGKKQDVFLGELKYPDSEVHVDPDIDQLFPVYRPEQSVLIESTLQKRGQWNPAWKSRYFLLEPGGRLSYFTSEEDKHFPERAKGMIPIDVRATIKGDGMSEDGRFNFKIVIPGKGLGLARTFNLSTPDNSMYVQWLSKLSSLQEKVIYTSLPQNVRHW
jgi:hypothetical protein